MTTRKLVMALALLMVAQTTVVGPATAHHDVGGWTRTIGSNGVLDYTAAQTVAVGDDGSIYIAGHFTTSFSANTAITGFDVFVQKWDQEGDLAWQRNEDPFGPGIPELDLELDGNGTLWMFVDNEQLLVYGSTDGIRPAGAGTFPTFDGDPSTTGAAGDDGFVVAEPALGQARMLRLDGSTAWSHVLKADTKTAEIVPHGDNTSLLVCQDTTGVAETGLVELDSTGATVDETAQPSQIIPGTGTSSSSTPGLLTVSWIEGSDVATNTACGTAPTAPIGLREWSTSPPRNIGTWSFPASYCVDPHLTAPLLSTEQPCPSLTSAENLSLRLGQPIAIDPQASDIVALVEAPEGEQVIVRTRGGGLLAAAYLLDANHFVADIDIGSSGKVVAVGTKFAPEAVGPDDPFNAQAFILYEPLGPGALSVAHPFVDVTSVWQQDAVTWAWATGVTVGVDSTHFTPDRLITRGEAAVMIHRAWGHPSPLSPHPFGDIVSPWQEEAVSWLHERGITVGVNATHFAPDRTITRGEIAAMLHRASADLSSYPAHPFVDVAKPWQEVAIRWMYARGISTGTDPTHFSPERPATRAEMVALLYRQL